MNEKVIAQRKSILENYLNFVLNKLDLIKYPILLYFIRTDIESSAECFTTGTILSSLSNINTPNTFLRKSKSSELVLKPPESNSLGNPYLKLTNNYDIMIDTFLLNLEDSKEDKSIHINNLWKAMFKGTNWANMKKESVAALLFGNQKAKGLLFHCGRVEENSLGAEAALNFVFRLTQHEFNPDCEFFCNILKIAKLEHIRQMKLNAHLFSNKLSIKEACFKLVCVFLNVEKGITAKTILRDKGLEKKFETWYELYENI